MNKPKIKYSRLKKWGKITGGILLGFLMILILIRFSLRTDFIRDWIKNYAVSIANDSIEGELSIKSLSGDLWKELILSEILLMGTDTLAKIDSVKAEYNVWALLHGQIEVTRFGIYHPQTYLKQKGEEWNFEQFVKPSADTSESETEIALKLDNLSLFNGHISVESDSLPVESKFEINNLELSSRLGYDKDGFNVKLRNLSFRIDQTRLENSIKLETTAAVNQDTVTLEKLVLSTGRSMIHTSASAIARDSSLQFDLSASPISWKDVADYASEFPLQGDVNIDISLNGKPEKFEFSLDMQTDGIESIRLSSQFQWDSTLTIHQIELESGYIDPQVLLGDTLLPAIQKANAKFTGRVDVSDYQHASGDLNFTVSQISLKPYELEEFSGILTLNNQDVNLNIDARRQGQKLNAELSIVQMFADEPSINAKITGSRIDPEYWMQDSTYTGDLSFVSTLSGRGWVPETVPWNYSLMMRDSRFANQPISTLSAEGTLSLQDASLDAELKIHESFVKIAANLLDMDSTPVYDFRVEINRFDIGKLMGIEDFTTDLNSIISGRGTGFAPETMQLTANAEIDSSVVNKELIERFSSQISIRDTVATIDSLSLKSTIADGSSDGRLHLLRLYDPNNKINLDLRLKDVRAFSPLVDVDTLEAEGRITGNLSPGKNDSLTFAGSVDLTGVNYDGDFIAPGIKGEIGIQLHKLLINYLVDLELKSPSFAGFELQDITFKSKGKHRNTQTEGQYELQLVSPKGRIEQASEFSVAEDLIALETTVFNIISEDRTMSLEKPSSISMRGDTVMIDTLRISSDDGALLTLAVPMLNPSEQQFHLHSDSLDIGVLQHMLMGESYLEGFLKARIEVARDDTSLESRGQLQLSELVYNDARFDSLVIKTEIEDERLIALLSLDNDRIQLIEGELDLPLKLSDTLGFFPDFEQPVSGLIGIQNVPLEHFKGLLPDEFLGETEGILSMHGELKGMLNAPDFNANLSLTNGTISGISVDSALVGVDYHHSRSVLAMNTAVFSAEKEMLEADAKIPFSVDFESSEISPPLEKDTVLIEVEASDFDLAILNDFTEQQGIDLAGLLNGKVQVSGVIEDIKMDGSISLTEGGFQFTEYELGMENIQSTISFEPSQILLSEFVSKGGKGTMKATGKIKLEKLTPGEINFNVEADNFRAADTPDYNAVINMKGQAQGTLMKPTISGEIDFVSGFVKVQNFGEESVEEVELDTLEEARDTVSVYDSLSLDLAVTFDPRFFILSSRSLDGEVSLEGELDIVKEPGKEMELFGTLATPQGYLRPLGKRFEINEEGSMTFLGDPMKTELEIIAEYSPPQEESEIIIQYIIEGTAEEPTFKFESDPPMELNEIISYTLFGEPFQVSDVALNLLSSKVESIASEKLGIDIVKIETERSGGESGTSITTGWYLAPKLLFAIQNIITTSSTQNFLLEYRFQKNLKLMILQGNTTRQGAYLQWDYDY